MRSLSRNVYKRGNVDWQKAAYPELMDILNRLPETEEAEEAAAAQKEQEEKGQALFEQSIQQAQAILARARQEASKIRKDAYEEGYIEGTKQGCSDGEKKAYEEQKQRLESEWVALQNRIEAYVTQMQHEKDKLLEEYLDDLKDISLAIGEKIIQTSLKSSSDVVKNMILAATDKLKRTAWAKIYIADSPEVEGREIQGDAELLDQLSKISDNVKIIVMGDAAPGTCIIELPQEVMDISVGTQMENIKEILNNARV